MKTKRVRLSIRKVIEQARPATESDSVQDERGEYQGKVIKTIDHLTDHILELAKNQNDY